MARGWGFSNRPADDGYHWAASKSLRDENREVHDDKGSSVVEESLVKEIARITRGGHDVVAQPAWAAWHVGPGGVW